MNSPSSTLVSCCSDAPSASFNVPSVPWYRGGTPARLNSVQMYIGSTSWGPLDTGKTPAPLANVAHLFFMVTPAEGRGELLLSSYSVKRAFVNLNSCKAMTSLCANVHAGVPALSKVSTVRLNSDLSLSPCSPRKVRVRNIWREAMAAATTSISATSARVWFASWRTSSAECVAVFALCCAPPAVVTAALAFVWACSTCNVNAFSSLVAFWKALTAPLAAVSALSDSSLKCSSRSVCDCSNCPSLWNERASKSISPATPVVTNTAPNRIASGFHALLWRVASDLQAPASRNFPFISYFWDVFDQESQNYYGRHSNEPAIEPRQRVREVAYRTFKSGSIHKYLPDH